MNTSNTWRNSLSSSFFYAFRGFRYLVRHRNFRIGVFVTALGVPAVWWLDRPYLNTFLIFSAIVLGFEAVNSALEELIDHIHPEFHVAIGRVKDMLAAATVMCVLAAMTSALLEAKAVWGWVGVAVLLAAALLIFIFGEVCGRCF